MVCTSRALQEKQNAVRFEMALFRFFVFRRPPRTLGSVVCKPALLHVHRPEFGSGDKEFLLQKGTKSY